MYAQILLMKNIFFLEEEEEEEEEGEESYENEVWWWCSKLEERTWSAGSATHMYSLNLLLQLLFNQ